MKKQIHFKEIENEGLGFYGLLGLLGFIVLVGLGAAWYMEHNGHQVTGMTNQVVWGTPHVFAVFLIVAASGALNVASISSVFGKLGTACHRAAGGWSGGTGTRSGAPGSPDRGDDLL
jgi:Ni/Fe-hydrogenase subunit HybB-like protein